MSLLSLTLPTGTQWGAVVLAYLIGSIPFGYTFARMKGVDIRSIGSGNIGATNTGRALGKPLGLLAFVLDFVKGWAPVALIAPAFAEGSAPASLLVLCGAAAVVGHCWPLYLGFKGGKGVASGCGAVIALDPMLFTIGGVVFVLMALGMGYMSLASIAMVVTFPIVAWYQSADSAIIFGCVAFAVLVIWRHRSNLVRLFAGLEPRFHSKK